MHYSFEGIMHQYLKIRGDVKGPKSLKQSLYIQFHRNICAYVYGIIELDEKIECCYAKHLQCTVVKDKFPLLWKFLKYVSAELRLRYEPKKTQILYNRLDADLY